MMRDGAMLLIMRFNSPISVSATVFALLCVKSCCRCVECVMNCCIAFVVSKSLSRVLMYCGCCVLFLVEYVVVSIQWSEAPVMCVVVLCISVGQFVVIWSMHDGVVLIM